MLDPEWCFYWFLMDLLSTISKMHTIWNLKCAIKQARCYKGVIPLFHFIRFPFLVGGRVSVR